MSGVGQRWQKPSGRPPPKLLIVLAGSFGTLLLAGGAYWFFQRKAPAEAEEKPKPTVPACEARRGELGFQLSDCYTKYAEVTAAPELCEALPVSGEAKYSRGDCVKHVALATGNAALCERVGGDGRSVCFRELAGAMEDVKLCEKVQSTGERERCYGDLARTLRDPEICRRVERDQERASCLFGAIHAGMDMKVCEMVQSASRRESCFADVARHDLSACLQLPTRRRAQCVRDSSQRREVDDPAVLCDGAADCLASVAELDITLCERISANERSLRSGCVESAIRRFGNLWVRPSTCDRLQDLELRDVCFNRIGHSDDHESACQRILNVALRNECMEAAKQKLARRL